MKRFNTILTVLLITASAFIPQHARAQAPQKISYQAVVRDSNSELIKSSTIGMRISITQGTIDGSEVYAETHSPITNENGLVTLEIGNGTVEIGDFSTIDWTNGPYFIKTETDPSGGVDYSITGTSQLLSVPYALHASTADSVTGLINENQNLGDVLSLGNDGGAKQIKNIADPTDNQDVVTRAYLDKVLGLYCSAQQGVSDYDGNYYKTVVIGDQIWMAENLKVTHYPDGTSIPNITDNTEWANLQDNDTDDAYCWYNNDLANKNLYGALYTYAVAIKACPEGWHLPSAEDWYELIEYIDYQSVLLTSKTGWDNNNRNGIDTYCFTALPGGGRYKTDGTFNAIGHDGYWWRSDVYYMNIGLSTGVIEMGYGNDQSSGISVRCIKD